MKSVPCGARAYWWCLSEMYSHDFFDFLKPNYSNSDLLKPQLKLATKRFLPEKQKIVLIFTYFTVLATIYFHAP